MKTLKQLPLSFATLALLLGLLFSCDKEDSIQEATPVPPVQEAEADQNQEAEAFSVIEAINVIIEDIYNGGGNATASYTLDQPTLDYYIQESGYTGAITLAEAQTILNDVLNAKQMGFENYLLGMGFAPYTEATLLHIMNVGSFPTAALTSDPQFIASSTYDQDLMLSCNNLRIDYENGTLIIPGSRATLKEICNGIVVGAAIGKAIHPDLEIPGAIIGGIVAAVTK